MEEVLRALEHPEDKSLVHGTPAQVPHAQAVHVIRGYVHQHARAHERGERVREPVARYLLARRHLHACRVYAKGVQMLAQSLASE